MLDDQEIKRLLLRAGARDEGSAEAFERLYRLCAPLLLGIAQRVVGRREVAEEVLHDALSSIWRKSESFDPLANQPVAWMVAIVRNRAIDVRSSHDVSRVDSYHASVDNDPDGALDRLFEWGPGPDENEDRRRAAEWLRDCLTSLQAVERQALVLAYTHGLSHSDLAVHLSKPLGTVKTWVRRGMESLRECVDARMGAAMKLESSRALDALCGEYLIGTLRGAARRRFERALVEEPRVALRLAHWRELAPRYSTVIEAQPSPETWRRLERDLDLRRYRTPWHRRLGVWRGFAAAVTAALVAVIAFELLKPEAVEAPSTRIAALEGKTDTARVTAALSRDRSTLMLQAARPVHAGPAQSYELWLIPVEGGAPLSLAVLGSLDARVPVAPAHSARLVPGAKLAVSVEPAGGSPTGGPTGPVIIAGQIGI